MANLHFTMPPTLGVTMEQLSDGNGELRELSELP